MKKIIGLIFASLILTIGLSIDSSAQSSGFRVPHPNFGRLSIVPPQQARRPYSVNARERRQQRRIYNGVRNGSLTRRETYRLERQQVNLRRTEARYRRSGGGLSWRERRDLQRRENRTSRSIYRQKHDRQNYGYPRKRL